MMPTTQSTVPFAVRGFVRAAVASPKQITITVALLLVCTTMMPHTMDAQTLSKSLTQRIDSIFANYNRNDSPGCAMAVYKDGKIIYAKGYGSADLEHNVPITPQSRFDIGSTSKQFTAACLVLLEEQGKLSLEDDVRKYIPELPDYGQTITIRMMLNHTSGLRDYLGLMLMSGMDIDDVTTTKDALRILTQQKNLDFSPGAAHEYSNTGYFLASVIVERVSGKSLREFAAEHLFRPLGMANTTYIDDHTEVLPNRAIGYSVGEAGAYHRDISNWEQNGDGGVFTSVEDLLLWDENFYQARVGGTVMTTALQRRGVLADGETIGYALGLYFDTLGGLETVEHGGSWGGYRADIIRVPSQHVSVAVLANREDANPSRMARRVLGIVLADRFTEPLPPITPTPATPVAEKKIVQIDPTLFDAYEGDYALDLDPSFVLTFKRDGDRYYSYATGQGAAEIFPSSDSTFFPKEVDASITFHREKDGSVSTMTLHQGGNYTARRVEKPMMTAEQLAPYTGEYYSPELGTRYRLVVEDGMLVAHHDRFDPITLAFAEEDHFNGDQWYLAEVEFERDEMGNVAALLVSAGRVQGLRFAKVE